MKKTIQLLLLAGSFVLPAVTHAETPEAKKKPQAKAAVVQPVASRKNVAIYYITATPRTGSAIPMVYRRYNDRIDSASNPAVYGLSSIESTGVLDVGTALYKLDSSIMLGGRRR